MNDSALTQSLNIKAQVAEMVSPFQSPATLGVSICETPER